VLAGKEDWIAIRGGIDLWLGGVHLEGPQPAWRWDPELGRLRSRQPSPPSAPPPAPGLFAALDAFDELLRFRHLFRSAYGARLDAARLSLVLAAAQRLRPIYRAHIEHFLDYVRAAE
jgi:hypothetical protein